MSNSIYKDNQIKDNNQFTVKLANDQKKWLYKEAIRQMSNISVLVRQAVQLLMNKSEASNNPMDDKRK